jgi:glycosyltransferase involved in cell wall biosynthesis
MTRPRVLVFGAWDSGAGYPRADSLLLGLRGMGCEVAEWRLDLPYGGRARQRLAASPWRWPSYWLRLRQVRTRCRANLADAIAEFRPDVLLVPYPGHTVVHWAREVFGGPIVLDLFLSAYDTIVEDRKLFGPNSIPAALLRRLDRRACQAADLVLLDTPDHAARIAELLALPRQHFGWIPATDARAPERALSYRPPADGQPLEVLFFGTGVPLHGLSVLLEAVQLTDGVRLTLVGGTPRERRIARALPPERIDLRPEFVPLADLHSLLERAHLVAGVFGTSEKAARVVPFKVVHALAAGRPVITADTPAVRRMLRPGKDCIVVRPGDPVDVAAALVRLRGRSARLAAMARSARESFATRFSMRAVERRLAATLRRLGIGAGATAPDPRVPEHV